MEVQRRERSQSNFNQKSEETCIHEQEYSWNVEVQLKDLGTSTGMAGLYQVRLNKSGFTLQKLHDPYNTMVLPLYCIRSCGCLREKFYLELGRSAITGEGKLWMLLQNTTTAKTMKKTCSRFFGKRNGNNSNARHRRRAQSLNIGRVTFSENIPDGSEPTPSETFQSNRNRRSSFVRDLYASFRRCVAQKQEEYVDCRVEQPITPDNKTPNDRCNFKRSMSVPANIIQTVSRVPTISDNTRPPTCSRGPPPLTEFNVTPPKLEILKSASMEEVKNYNYRGFNTPADIMNSSYTTIEESPFEREKQDLRASFPRKPSIIDNLCRKAERYLPTEQYLPMTPKQESKKTVCKVGTSNTDNFYLPMKAKVQQASEAPEEYLFSSAPEEYLLISPSGSSP